MIEIKSFSSGSKGNLYYVSNDETKILLECDVAKEFGVTVDKIEETAMRGLIDFHSLIIDEP